MKARKRLRELMQRETNGVVVAESQLALILIGNPDDVRAIREYATPRIETLDGSFLRNLHRLDDPWVEELLEEAWEKATDNQRRREVVHAQTLRRSRMTR